MIRSFKDSQTEKVWNREQVGAFGPDLQRAAHKMSRSLTTTEVLDPTFRTDIAPLIEPWPSDYDIDTAGQLVTDLLLGRIHRS